MRASDGGPFRFLHLSIAHPMVLSAIFFAAAPGRSDAFFKTQLEAVEGAAKVAVVVVVAFVAVGDSLEMQSPKWGWCGVEAQLPAPCICWCYVWLGAGVWALAADGAQYSVSTAVQFPTAMALLVAA